MVLLPFASEGERERSVSNSKQSSTNMQECTKTGKNQLQREQPATAGSINNASGNKGTAEGIAFKPARESLGPRLKWVLRYLDPTKVPAVHPLCAKGWKGS
jgi:hypothetical protein